MFLFCVVYVERKSARLQDGFDFGLILLLVISASVFYRYRVAVWTLDSVKCCLCGNFWAKERGYDYLVVIWK